MGQGLLEELLSKEDVTKTGEDMHSDINSKSADATEKISEKMISLDYTKKLKKMFGLKKAFDIVQKYSKQDIISAEKILDKLSYEDVPQTPKGKMDSILKLIEIDEKIPTKRSQNIISTMSEYQSKISLTLSGLERVFNAIEEHKFFQGNIHDWPSFKDKIFNFSQEILEKYGKKLSEWKEGDGDIKEIFLGQCHSEKYFLPNVKITEVIGKLCNISQSSKKIYTYDIPKGFDDWTVALEFASKKKDDYDSYPYISFGMTSLKAITELEFKDINKINETLDNQYHKQIKEYLNGDIEKFKGFADLVLGNPRNDETREDAYQYFNAVENTADFVEIYKMTDKPTHYALGYAKRNFEVKDWNDLVDKAKQIDNPNNNVFLVGEVKTVEDFKKVVQRYDKANNIAKEKDIGRDIQSFEVKFIEERPEDVLFLKYFNVYNFHHDDLTDEDKTLNIIERIKKYMTANEYDDLAKIVDPEIIQGSEVKKNIAHLLEIGYTQGDLLAAGKKLGEILSSYPMYQIIPKLENDNTSLEKIFRISEQLSPSNTDMIMHYAVTYGDLFCDPSNKKNMSIPYTMIPIMEKHNMSIYYNLNIY